MSKVWVKLTEQQKVMLRPYMERVGTAAAMGSPGILVGQIEWDGDSAWFVPCFIPHAKAQLLEQSGNTNIPPFKPACPPGQHFYIAATQQDMRPGQTLMAVCAKCDRPREA